MAKDRFKKNGNIPDNIPPPPLLCIGAGAGAAAGAGAGAWRAGGGALLAAGAGALAGAGLDCMSQDSIRGILLGKNDRNHKKNNYYHTKFITHLPNWMIFSPY
jgi:hypothetical protein